MRIPYKINKNTLVAYQPSSACFALLGEANRLLPTENLDWDQNNPLPLTQYSVHVIKSRFEEDPLLDELPCPDRDYLLEILDVKLPLELMIPKIEDEIYWQRRYLDNFGSIIHFKRANWTWKSIYLERHVRETVENAQPEHKDEENMNEILTLCAPYVQLLIITQLLCWKPPLHWDPEDIPEFYPIDHIHFEPIFRILQNIVEFDLIFGLNNVSESFHQNMFNLSVADCEHLGKALLFLKQLKVLKIHRSRIGDEHIRAFIQNFISNETVEELDLSHCDIADQGALCIAKLLIVHPRLRSLDLSNNRIRTLGCEGIGFALLQDSCCLEKLNLKLNPLMEGGAMGIYRALVRGTKLIELSLAVCQFEDKAPLRTGQMLMLNKTLKRLDVSNNWFDEEGGQALVDGLQLNTTIEWLDVRETDISQQQLAEIKKALLWNRNGVGEDEEEEFIGSDVTEEESEEDMSSRKGSAEKESILV